VTFVLVGSWQDTLGANDGGGGISVLRLSTDGELLLSSSRDPHLAVGGIAIGMRGERVYALNETKRWGVTDVPGGSVSVYTVDRDSAELHPTKTVPTYGVFPNSIAIDHGSTFLAVSNYGSEESVIRTEMCDGRPRLIRLVDEGSVAVLALDGAGDPTGRVLVRPHTRVSGVDGWRQGSPHPHGVAVSKLSGILAVADRGGDTVSTYRVGSHGESIELLAEHVVAGGQGPRTLAFAPDGETLIVTSELEPFVSRYIAHSRGTLEHVETVPSVTRLPEDRSDFYALPHPSGLAISRDGQFAYVLNRGEDTIAQFELSAGGLRLIRVLSSEGSAPWCAAISPDGRHLLVGNKGSSSISVFDIDDQAGMPRWVQSTEVPNPASIAFFDAR